MLAQLPQALAKNFLGTAPPWYKATLVGFLLLNPVLLLVSGPFVTGWVLVAEFIFALAMSLKCYPLLPGGLLALEAVLLGMTTPASVYFETTANFSVILLLIFMVAGIYFLRDLLLLVFTKLLVRVRSKALLALTFTATAALLSAFLDALTVAAVVIAVATGFYAVYHRFASGRGIADEHDHDHDELVGDAHREDLRQFRAFLRNLVMHAAVGTAIGGVSTLVGEPQNLLIGKLAGWDFIEFFVHVAPVSLPVLVVGLLTCLAVERFGWFGYGVALPESVREIMVQWETRRSRDRDARTRARLIIQALTAIALVVGLALHVAEVGLVGLTVIVLATAFNGVSDERAIGHAFEEALPFTALLVTFFAIVAVIHDQALFDPVIELALAQHGQVQLAAIFLASGVLSAVSDNVFVGTVYITELKQALDAGVISRDQFELLAVSINTGTNIPSIATPNGQAAFLFLLTSALAPLIRLGYLRMVWMALPYTVLLSATALLATVFLL